MASSKDSLEQQFLFVGNRLCLDFINTELVIGGQPVDWLINFVPGWVPSGLVSWIPPVAQFIYILFTRELPGTLLVLGYFIALPPVLAVTVFRSFYQKMGFIRYMVLANLLLFMAALPIKMVLRWSFNLKYLIAIPEYFLNF